MQVKTFNPYKDLDKVFKWYRDVIVQTDSTWLENGRDCRVNSKLQVARWPDCMFLLTVLLSSSSHAVRVQWLTVAPPMLTQTYAESQIWRHPLHTYPGSGRSSSRSEALAPRVLLLLRLATTMSQSGSTASGTLTRGNVTRIPLRGGTVEWKQDWGASYMHMQSGCTLRLYRAPTCYV